jgi:hypothetical protein
MPTRMTTATGRLAGGSAAGMLVEAPVPIVGGPADEVIWVTVVDDLAYALGAAPYDVMRRAPGLTRYRRHPDTKALVYVHDPENR